MHKGIFLKAKQLLQFRCDTFVSNSEIRERCGPTRKTSSSCWLLYLNEDICHSHCNMLSQTNQMNLCWLMELLFHRCSLTKLIRETHSLIQGLCLPLTSETTHKPTNRWQHGLCPVRKVNLAQPQRSQTDRWSETQREVHFSHRRRKLTIMFHDLTPGGVWSALWADPCLFLTLSVSLSPRLFSSPCSLCTALLRCSFLPRCLTLCSSPPAYTC